MPNLWKCLQEDLVLDNGHLLDQFLKRTGILQRILHKELGVISRKKCCWNSEKADIQPSVQRLHCPGSTQEQRTRKTVNILRWWWAHNWDNFSHHNFCQSAQCLRNSGSFMWRTWEPSRWIGWTWDFDGSINCSRWNWGRSSCEREVIVQGDEGPVRGVAQVVDCHGVTVSHQEREEEVENTQGTLRMSMDGMTMKNKCERLEPCGMWCEWIKHCNYRPRAIVLNSACCACPRASRHSCCCPQWSYRSWRCACRCTHFYVAICHSHSFVNFLIKRYCIYTPVGDSRLLSTVTDIFTINFAFNCCWDSYRKMNSWCTEYTSFPVQSMLTPSLWWILIIGFTPICLPLPPWRGTLWPLFIVLLVLRFLEAVQCRQCFLEVKLMPCRHRIEIHHVRTNPPIATIRQFLLWWQYNCGFRLRWISSERTNSIIVFWRTCRGWIGRGCCHISSCDTSFEINLLCGILCNQVLSRTCDRVVGLFLCKNSGWRTNPTRMRCTSCFL